MQLLLITQTRLVLSATTGGISICSFTSVFGAPLGIASASFTLFFSLAIGIVKKLLSTTKNKKKKPDKIFMLAKDKLNSIETLFSQALIGMEISHKEFVTILKEKDKYEKVKENLRSENKKQEIIRLSTLFFSLAIGIVKKLLSTTKNKKKKPDKIFMLAKDKLNSIETLFSQALIGMEISYKEFVTILKEKDKYEKLKENLRSENEKQEIIRLSSIKLKN